MEEEQKGVEALITEYADIFACSLSEVTLIPGARVDLNVPKDARFNTNLRQRPLSPPQKQYMHKWVQQMLDANMVERADVTQIKHIAPTVLTQKTHDATGAMTLEDLQAEVNQQCEAAGLPTPFNKIRTMSQQNDGAASATASGPTKWRVTQNFAELNRVTQVPPLHQGDIRAKQQQLSGHRFVSVFDFTLGFYAIEVPEEWRPYLAFFVEGRGYFWYTRMPMGWTGAPTTFSGVVTERVHDLLADNTFELFVDDGGIPDNTFQGMMNKLQCIFNRCREHHLSLSLTKCHLFMTETTFAGATVGPQGVQPDLAKLTTVVKWLQPEDVLNLLSFLGLTGHFRDLI